MMGEKGEKVEAIEVNILSDDGTINEKLAFSTNGVNHVQNGSRLPSIADDVPTQNGQSSDKNQSTNDDEIIDDHQKCNVRRFYKQLKSICFPRSCKNAERQQRIDKLMVSINSIETNLNNVPTDTWKYRKTVIELSLFGIAVLIVVAVFMIPVILYYTGPPINEVDDSTATFFKTCRLNCLNYTGTSQICENIPGLSFIPSSFAPNQDAAEERLSEILNVTSGLQSSCSDSNAVSFFCKAAYRTCIPNPIYVPFPSVCEELQNNNCSDEWTEIQSIAPTLSCCNSYNPNSVCPDQFDKFCHVCAPQCHKFSQFDETTTVAIHVIKGIATIFGDIVFGIIVFVAAFVKRRTVFLFPNVLILYFTAVFMIYGVFAALPLFWRKELLCSDDNLFVAIAEPTTYCQIQGFAFDAAIVIFTEFWFLFVFHLFMKVVDPLKSWTINRPEHTRKVHMIEVVSAITLGLIVPIINVATDGYTIGIFPPTQCFPKPEVFFHGVLLPTVIMCIVGISLILFTLLHIHRTTGIFKRMKKKKTFALSVPEVKLLVISCYLTLVLGASLIQFTLHVLTLNDRIDATMDYSQCVGSGNCNCDDEREMVENTSIPEIAFIFFITIFFLNCSNLLFIIQFQDVKQVARRATKSFITTELS